MSKDERIKAEYERLSALFKNLPGDQRAVCEPLLQNSAFMCITLQDLQQAINTNGITDTYQNGNNQYGTKASAELNAYNATIKNYNTVQHKLLALLPKDQGKSLEETMAELMREEQ